MKSQRHKELLVKMHETYLKKNHDYGDAFGITYEKYGLVSAFIRISDKFLRIENLILNGNQKVDDESISDTLLDLANYCLMTKMEMDNAKR